MAAFAGILNLVAMLLSMKSVLVPLLGKEAEALTFQIPLYSLPLILLVTILLAFFVAAGMMILASFARNFREGQAMVSPFYIAVFVPVMFLQAPGLQFTAGLAFIRPRHHPGTRYCRRTQSRTQMPRFLLRVHRALPSPYRAGDDRILCPHQPVPRRRTCRVQ